MSAYGVITRPLTSTISLAPTAWACKPNAKRPDSPPKQLKIHHLTLAAARSLPGLIEHLRAVFTLEIKAGRTYPQETLDGDGAFEAYFFAADVFLAIVGDGEVAQDAIELNETVEESQQGRNWDDCIAGFYYVGICILIAVTGISFYSCRSNQITLDDLRM